MKKTLLTLAVATAITTIAVAGVPVPASAQDWSGVLSSMPVRALWSSVDRPGRPVAVPRSPPREW